MSRVSETGNVLFLILVAVILFGALSFTVGQMLRSGNADIIGDQQASILADETLATARQYRQAIQAMRISNACDDTEISFETSALTGYTNGSNTDCQIFNADGGGLTYIASPSDITTMDWVFTGSNIVDDVGTVAPDLVAILPNINLKVCNQINEKTNTPAVGTDATVSFTRFTGTYASTQTLDFAAGLPNGCLNYVNAGDNYFFYQVLIAR
ncbi:MAG: hypothetical protein AAF204_04075 [Pseudomonadota bacterium]